MSQVILKRKPLFKSIIEIFSRKSETTIRIETQIKHDQTLISETNGSQLLKRHDCHVAIICDKAMYDNYQPWINLYYLTPTNYEKIFSDVSLDAILITGTYRGINGEWQGCSKKTKAIVKTIEHIQSIAKSKNIPLLFQAINDPTDYSNFLWLAKCADFIFTPAKETIKKYQEETGKSQVFACPLGINPLTHNPIGRTSKPPYENTVIFSGGWNKKHSIRCKDSAFIFDEIIKTSKNLLIIDHAASRSSRLKYPSKYRSYVTRDFNYQDLPKMKKIFDWSILINRVKNSFTSFTLQGFELQAYGNLILSNFNAGIADQFPNIFTIFDNVAFQNIFEKVSASEKRILINTGIRNVMFDNTFHSRLTTLLTTANINIQPPKKTMVAVVIPNNSSYLQNQFQKQSYQHKTLFIEKIPEADYQHFDIICFLGEDHDYSVFYLEDMINAFIYTACDFITKNVYQINHLFSNVFEREGEEHQFTSHFSDKNRTIFWRRSYHYEELFITDASATPALKSGYSADSINYCYKPIPSKTSAQKYKFSVVIPIYNNYKHLLRALLSLKMEAYFSEIEILIIDDGSTDQITPHVIKEYAQLYPNISCYFYETGGSGSASRPRNKGVELATTDYITFLDADDAGTGRYSHLYDEIIRDNDCDFVFGNNLRITAKVSKLLDFTESFEIPDPKQFFINSGFKPYRIQAAMYKRDFLITNKIQNVVGAIGEDTVFSYETLLKAKRTKYINLPIDLYYYRNDSVTRTCDAAFFRKHIGAELHKKQLFQEYNLYDVFLKTRHGTFIERWYFNKLNKETLADPLIKQSLQEILSIHQGIVDYLSPRGKSIYQLIHAV